MKQSIWTKGGKWKRTESMQWHSLPMLVHPQNFELSAAQLPGISKVAAFAFEFTSEAFEGGGGNHNLAHTCLHRDSKDATHSKHPSGIEQTRAGEGSTSPGCKKMSLSLFLWMSASSKGRRLGRRGRAVRGSSCCAGGRKAHQEQQPENQRAQSIQGPPPAPARYPGTPLPPDLVRGLGPALGSNCRGQNRGSRAAKLTWSPQKDAEYCCHGFVVRNA